MIEKERQTVMEFESDGLQARYIVADEGEHYLVKGELGSRADGEKAELLFTVRKDAGKEGNMQIGRLISGSAISLKASLAILMLLKPSNIALITNSINNQ